MNTTQRTRLLVHAKRKDELMLHISKSDTAYNRYPPLTLRSFTLHSSAHRLSRSGISPSLKPSRSARHAQYSLSRVSA